MIRMAHRILTAKTIDGVVDFRGSRTQSLMDELHERSLSFRLGCSQATVIVADNVSDYYWSQSKESWSTSLDFPNCLPFEKCVLVEWNSPRNCDHSSVGGIACLLVTFDRLHDLDDPSVAKEFASVADNVRWIVQGSSMIFTRQGLFFSVPFIQLDINFDGDVGPMKIRGLHDGGSPDFRQDLITTIHSKYHIPLLAMSFANCKNVTKTIAGKECDPDRPWARKHKPPEIKYHVLNINPMKEVLRTEGSSETNGIAKALHICRGHFKRYTEEAPRFGRDVGTFWCPSHVRGNVENGIVDKDYSIKLGTPISKDSHEEKDHQGNRPQPERPETAAPMDQPDNGDA